MNLNEYKYSFLIIITILICCSLEMYHFTKVTKYTNKYNSNNWSIIEHLIQNYAKHNLTHDDTLKHLFNVQHDNVNATNDKNYNYESRNNKSNLNKSDKINKYSEHEAIALHVNYGRPEFGTHRILWIKLILAVIYGILAFMGITSNLIVAYILLFMRRRALNSITNIFVLVLAISDILLCSFNMPLQAYYELKETLLVRNDILCKFIFACFGLPMHISCLTILLIACDRYQIIIYPLRPRMSVRLAIILICLTVIISIINAIPIALFNMVSNAINSPGFDIIFESQLYMYQSIQHSTTTTTTNHNNRHSYCVENWPNPESRLLYSILVFFIHFLIPLILTACLYGHIYYRLHERRFRKGSVERKRRTNKILIRIVICFAVCWTPWTCFSLWLEIHAYEIQKNALNLNNNNNYESGPNLNYMTTTTTTHDSVAEKMMHLNKFYLTLNKTNQIHATSNHINTNMTNSPSTLAATVDNTSTLMSSSHSHQIYKNYRNYYTLHPMGGNIKLLDLSLKLLAMTSACINPWLYGWFKKFIYTMTKKTLQKLKQYKLTKHNMLRNIKHLKDKYSLCFTKKFTMESIKRQINQYHSDADGDGGRSDGAGAVCCAGAVGGDADGRGRGEDVVGDNDVGNIGHNFGNNANHKAGDDDDDGGENEMNKNEPKLNVYICYCCGAICTCQLSLKWLKRRDHYRHITRYHDNESCLIEPLTRTINEYTERRILNDAVIADLIKQTRNSSRGSNSNSSRPCGSKSSNGPLAGGNLLTGIGQHHEKPTDTNSSTGKYGKLNKETAPTTTKAPSSSSSSAYLKFRRRTSSRLSGFSFGTMSYLDPSTKQTSLFPSSGVLPTPRSSFLNTASHASRNDGEDGEVQSSHQPQHQPHQQQQQHSHYELQVPSISHDFISTNLLTTPNSNTDQYPMNSRQLTSNLLKPLPDTDSYNNNNNNNYNHEMSSECEGLLNITIPIPMPSMPVKGISHSELDKVNEQSNESISISLSAFEIPPYTTQQTTYNVNISSNSTTTKNILPEIIKVNVHTQTNESKDQPNKICLLRTNITQNNDDNIDDDDIDINNRYEDCSFKINITDKDSLIKTDQNPLQIKLSDSYAASIPFVDEESSIIDENLNQTECFIIDNDHNGKQIRKTTDDKVNREVVMNCNASIGLTSHPHLHLKHQHNEQYKQESQATIHQVISPYTNRVTKTLTIDKSETHASLKEKKPRKLSSIYKKPTGRRISQGINLLVHKPKPSEKHDTDEKLVKRRLSFHDKVTSKRQQHQQHISHPSSEEKRRHFDKKQSSDIFASLTTSEDNEISDDLDDFAHISRMVAIEVMRKRRARERARSVCIGSTVTRNRMDRDGNDLKVTTPTITAMTTTTTNSKSGHEEGGKSLFHKRKSFTVFPRLSQIPLSISSSSSSTNRQRYT
uniref:G_PROTEIN_RECEP_F1_2 domain-containing protein n=1 Tax=Trichobilharzia regenti TaxID=157069 RepID=A0AA85ITY9_TRIRE|nr:unnamed protein product [Trichobilharzia regenti]